MLAQRIEHIGTVAIHRGQRRPGARNLIETEPGSRRRESLVYKDFDRIGVIDREEPQLIEVRGLPQLLGDLQDVAPDPRLQRLAGDFDVFL